ncbi:DUF4097 family beta strand repeat-containing protein [Marinitenerispora sediminis]|uniref:DUF4097 domain-containing protein n=1 Tax=Marinitenerispora sediminis TaxID=1931232 RepID=A0A368T8I8_9ACTN|nr:DUF4097 family beta strand repeat-containing protein [Marinitenerispora sediminis]RCV55046.1 hypothetical protein DEF28_06645 [Marinitenerispora sediminis]RCV58011.1 hypothetical protein DEF23_09680 [Marinitenerispora sediminis]RCV60692.1 hypothetical protein DEF24_06305 [Marinitenerispora sediminis]
MAERSFTAPKAGPIALDLHLSGGTASVLVSDRVTTASLTVTGTQADVDEAEPRNFGDQWTVRSTARGRSDNGGGVHNVISGGVQHGPVIQVVNAVSVSFGPGGMSVNGQPVSTGHHVSHTESAFHIEAVLPAGSSLNARTKSAGVDVKGLPDTITFSSNSGELTTDGARSLNADTVSGEVIVDGAVNDAEITTVSGSVSLNRTSMTGTVEATSASGRISIDAARGSVRAQTTSSRIKVHAVGPTNITATSISGNVKITKDDEVPVDDVQVNALSVSGKVSTPPGTSQRPRRPAGGLASPARGTSRWPFGRPRGPRR